MSLLWTFYTVYVLYKRCIVKDAKEIGVDIEIGIMSAIYLQEGKDGKREFLKKHLPE